MATILKVDEWKTASGHWCVADTHTHTTWRACADILGAETQEDFLNIIRNKYNAIVEIVRPDFIMFWWPSTNYKDAHQFKLDVNRIARKKNYLI